jgi:SEC-C motif-containing protein
VSADPCPCGTGLPYAACCGPFHNGAVAPTAEQLMRSRYAAFARRLPAYLLDTWHPTTRPRTLVLDPSQEWVGLTVLEARGGLLDSEGVVEFRASWRHSGETGVLHERSRFVREGGRWLYVQGAVSSSSSSRPPGPQSPVR